MRGFSINRQKFKQLLESYKFIDNYKGDKRVSVSGSFITKCVMQYNNVVSANMNLFKYIQRVHPNLYAVCKMNAKEATKQVEKVRQNELKQVKVKEQILANKLLNQWLKELQTQKDEMMEYTQKYEKVNKIIDRDE